VIGERANYFADVTGDGKADAILLNQTDVLIYPSTGTGFEPAETWTGGHSRGN